MSPAGRAAPSRGWSERYFALILRLFPRSFRARFGDDMCDLFRDQLRAARAGAGRRGVIRLWLRTTPAVVRAAALERWDVLREPPAPSPVPPTERHRAARSERMLETFRDDLRFAGRMLRKSPVFTVVAVLCISLGSGAVTTIFSAMNALVLRPLPGTLDPDRLVRIERVRRDGEAGTLSASRPYYEYLRDGSRTLDGVAAWGKATFTISTGDGGAEATGNMVSGNFFSVLGVRPALGRFFAPDEDSVELAHPVIVVSERFWRTRLGADSGVVGRAVTVNGNPFTLIGVAPAEFAGLDAPIVTDAWVPLAMKRQIRGGGALADAAHAWLRLCGRLRDGVSPDVARRELTALNAARARDVAEPEWFLPFTEFQLTTLTSLPPDASAPLLGFLAMLLVAAGLVLLIASVNVASMLSARAIARRREMAVRAALGAGRGRLVRQLLTEILALFVLGALGGVVLAVFATSALERLPIPVAAAGLSIALELSPDPRVFGFALLVSLATGLTFGLAPALRAARTDISVRLRSDSAAAGARRTFTGNSLVVGQLAVSLLLLVGAGLFLRALERGRRIDPGFDRSNVAVAHFNTESWGYDEVKARAFFGALRERLGALPGVTAVSYAMHLPLTMHSTGDNVRIDVAGAPAGGQGTEVPVWLSTVDADYFDAVRIPIVRGRSLGANDHERAAKSAVVNETLARRYWPDGSAIGRTLRYQGHPVTIVGVARDSKYWDLSETTRPFVYFPMTQHWQTKQVLLVRTTAGPESLAPAIQRAVREIDPALPRPTVGTLERENGIVLLPQRVAAMVTGALGAVGLLLATVGLYGIIAYSAGRRTREIGVRIALGARRSDVLGMIVREGMLLAGIGVVIGLLLATAATRLIARFLFSVSPVDVVTFATTSVLFVAVALVASYLPARRAAASDPVAALRAD